MNDKENGNVNEAREFRPEFTLYHANGRGTGCAIKMDLHPAHGTKDGCFMLSMAGQKTVGQRTGAKPTYATFDWENKICVKLDFSDICKMLQVLRGECESIEDGKGLYHRSAKYTTRIVLRHMLEPTQGYSLEVYRSTPDNPGDDRSARIIFTNAEAMGLGLAFENSIGIICFGIPRLIPHDTSAYEAQTRRMLDAAVA